MTNPRAAMHVVTTKVLKFVSTHRLMGDLGGKRVISVRSTVGNVTPQRIFTRLALPLRRSVLCKLGTRILDFWDKHQRRLSNVRR